MRTAYWLLAVAACNGADAPAMMSDASPSDATQPSPSDATQLSCDAAALQGMFSMPATACAGAGGFPAACARPAGVTWIEPSFYQPVTAALPAGFYTEDPIGGCEWIVVWPTPHGGFTVEASAQGCTMAMHLPALFTQDGCGHASLRATGCTKIYIDGEACYSTGRGASVSGTFMLSIDGNAGTLTTFGATFDTSSSPASCGCH